MTPLCEHLGQVVDVTATDERACEDCVREGTTWHHLRMCRTCGHMGCCDQSPQRHASLHFRLDHHPIMRTTEPSEDWTWCFLCERTYRDAPGGGFVEVDLYTEAGVRIAGAWAAAGGAMPPGPGARSPEGFPLGDWARHVREQRRTDELSATDRAAIEALPGWSWAEVSDPS
jgi:Zn-finger in ubiquitin-hydrolases and other protein